MSKSCKISKELRWEGAHRLLNHPGLCKHIHGHSFRIRITVESVDGLDAVGMGVEFSKIKSSMQRLIDDKLDHALILWDQDPLIGALGKILSHAVEGEVDPALVAFKDVYNRIYAAPCNPTSENLAEHFWQYIEERLPEGIFLSEIWFAETQSCAVTLTRKSNA